MNRFGSKVAIVTGGGSGIGHATVEELIQEGARVAVFDISVTEVREHPNLRAFQLDIRDEQAINDAVALVAEEWGGIDVLVNAVGMEYVASVAETTSEGWDRVIDTNLKGYFLTTRAVLPHLQESKGNIVNVASQLALVGARFFSAYTASKAAILGFTRSAALEAASFGVRVNAVCPGAVDTPLLQRQFADGRVGPQGTLQKLTDMHPVGRLGKATEIARPILFLASEDASFITGSTLVVDGGYTAW